MVTIHFDYRVLVCASDGRVRGDEEQGFVPDTSLVTGYGLRLGRPGSGRRQSVPVSPPSPILFTEPVLRHSRSWAFSLCTVDQR